MFRKAARRALIWLAVITLVAVAIWQMPDRYQAAAAAFQKGDYVSALKMWRKLARGGDAVAQYNLGVLYRSGTGVEPSDSEAHRWFMKSAEKGTAAAEFEVGKAFETGQGAPRSLSLAVTWITRAAEQGFAPAQIDLGLKYLSGTGVDQNAERAAFWLGRVVGADRQTPVMIDGKPGTGFALPCETGT